MSVGAFLCFEGIDGCGKSTQVKLLYDFLSAKGKDVLQIREPGGTVLSEQIRNILLDKKNTEMTAETEFLLYNAARAQLLREKIQPAIQEGKIVIADRFAWSSLAYQGYGRQMNLSQLQKVIDFTCGEIIPVRTWLLDLSVEEAEARRTGEADRLESAGRKFFTRVREGYLDLAKQNPEWFSVLDAKQSSEKLHQMIVSDLNQMGI